MPHIAGIQRIGAMGKSPPLPKINWSGVDLTKHRKYLHPFGCEVTVLDPIEKVPVTGSYLSPDPNSRGAYILTGSVVVHKDSTTQGVRIS